MAGRRLLWRVPVWLALPTTGSLGQVGTLDVDAQTGEILSTQQILEQIAERGDELARHTVNSPIETISIADSQTCKPANLQTCQLADLQTCQLADLQT